MPLGAQPVQCVYNNGNARQPGGRNGKVMSARVVGVDDIGAMLAEESAHAPQRGQAGVTMPVQDMHGHARPFRLCGESAPVEKAIDG